MSHRTLPGDGPVDVVVVGAGGMGRGWMRTVIASPSARLVGVADVFPEAAVAAVSQLEADGAVPDGTVLTGSDGVTVARAAGAHALIDVTIPAAHHEVTADGLHAGIPVLGEKPCAATLAEALSLAGHAEQTGELFMVSQSRRHNPHLEEAARLVEELGGAGIVSTRFARAPRFGGFRDAMDHPLIVDMAIHAFDAGRVLLPGVPVSVQATSYNPAWSWYAGDAAATVVITYDTGAVHTYTGSWCSPGRETSWNGEWMVSCPLGSVEWDGDGPPSATGADGRERAGSAPPPDALWEFAAALEEFCSALRTGAVPASEVHRNVWSQAIVEAAVRSAEERREISVSELLASALDEARALDRRDGRSRALETWEDAVTGLRAH